MLRDLFEIGFSYIQYVLLLVAIAPQFFPYYFNWPQIFLKYVNLDLTEVLSESRQSSNLLTVNIPEQLPLDIRLQFLLVSVIVPLLLAVVSLFSLSSKTFFFWFLFLLCGIMFLVMAVLAFAIDDPILKRTFTAEDRNFALYVGIAVIAFAGAVAFTYRSIQKANEKGEELKAQENKLLRRKQRIEAGLPVTESDVSSDGSDTDSDAGEFNIATSNLSAREITEAKLRKEKKAAKRKAAKEKRRQLRKQQAADDEVKENSPQLKSVMSIVKGEQEKDHGLEEDTADAGGKASLEDIMRKEVENFSIWPTVERFFYSAICIFFGLLLLGAYEIDAIYERQANDDAMNGIGAALFVLGVILFLWFLLGLTKRGRILMFQVSTFARDNFVSALLLLVTMLYVPAVSNIVMIIDCEEYTCAPQTRPPDPFSVVPVNATNPRCEVCDFSFVPQNCPLSLQAELCGVPHIVDRLKRNPSIECASLKKYYWPASGVMFVSFVISMPLLNFILTKKSTVILEDEFPLDTRQVEGFTDEELFYEKVHMSDNVAKFIYDPFQRRFKHWRSLFLFQKLFIVVVSVFTFPRTFVSSETLSIALSLVIHLIVLSYVLVTSPFNRKVENFLMVVTQFVLIGASACGLSVSQNETVPTQVFIAIAVFAFLLPAGSLGIGAILTFRDNIQKEQDREDRVSRAQRKAQVGEDGQEETGPGEMASFSGGYHDSEVGSGVGPTSASFDDAEFTARDRSFSPAQGMMAGGGGPASPLNYSAHMSTTAASTVSVGSPLMPEMGANMVKFKSNISILAEDFKVCDTLLQRGPTMHPYWFSLSKLSMVSPMHRYAYIQALNKRKTKLQSSSMSPEQQQQQQQLTGQKGTHTAFLLRSQVMPAESTGNFSFVESPENYFGGGRSFGHNMLRQESETVSSGAASSPASNTAAAATTGGGPRTFRFIQMIGKERWARVKQSLLDKVRADREKAYEAELEKSQLNGGMGAKTKSFFSRGGTNNGGNVKVGTGKYKNTAAMAQWDDLLKELIKKGREEKSKREGEAAAANQKGGKKPGGKKGGPGGGKLGIAPEAATGAASKRQQLELRSKLKALYEQHLQKLQSQQKAVDFKINKHTINAMQLFYVAVGVMAFIALGFCVLGVMSNTPPETFLKSAAHAGSRLGSKGVSYTKQLAGYTSWLEFTSNCCCQPFDISGPFFPHYATKVEKWSCANGNIKERVRAYEHFNTTTRRASERSGLLIRSLCGMTFAQGGCNVLEDPTDQFAYLTPQCAYPGVHAEELELW